MFRISQGPSSGSRELCLTEVTDIGSVLAAVSCMVSVWLHILTLDVCVYCTDQRSTALTNAIDTHIKGQDMQPNTDHTHSNCQYGTNTCNFS
jgi:hypothetical protein